MLPARAPTALMWRYCVRWRPPWLASSPVRLTLEASRQPGGAMTRHASRPSSAISSSDKRSRLVSAAVSLAYQNGFGDTTLADIAREAEVPLGNVYYYFKTKDEIGKAIVEFRLDQLGAQRQRWDEAGSPKDRLCACVQGVFENKEVLAQRGCAVGTFCSELHKAGGSVATRARRSAIR